MPTTCPDWCLSRNKMRKIIVLEHISLDGEVAQYEDKYRLCYMRGPAGIIVALAEELF